MKMRKENTFYADEYKSIKKVITVQQKVELIKLCSPTVTPLFLEIF